MSPIIATLTWASLVTTMGLFYGVSITAGSTLLFPTLWITYLTALNWQVYAMNKGRLPMVKGKEEHLGSMMGEREGKKVR